MDLTSSKAAVEKLMRKLLRALVLLVAHNFGTKIFDQRTGQQLGRALIIPWRGKIHIVGLNEAVVPTFLAQKRLTYWKQKLGFTTHASPDFPNIRSTTSAHRAENQPELE